MIRKTSAGSADAAYRQAFDSSGAALASTAAANPLIHPQWRMLVEQLDYNPLSRWFVGLSLDDKVWDHSTFSKNRDRLIAHDMSTKFFWTMRQQAEKADLLSNEHFPVDGTLIEAWASVKSFRPEEDQNQDPPSSGGRNAEVDFKGQKRKIETHQLTTDPDCQ